MHFRWCLTYGILELIVLKNGSNNPYLTNYGQNTYFWIFFEIIRVSAISAIHRYPKKNEKNKKNKKTKKKLVNLVGLPRKCAYHALIWMF
jgi:hypothetical protein